MCAALEIRPFVKFYKTLKTEENYKTVSPETRSQSLKKVIVLERFQRSSFNWENATVLDRWSLAGGPVAYKRWSHVEVQLLVLFFFLIQKRVTINLNIYIRETSIPVGIRRRDWRDPKALTCCTLLLVLLVQVVHNQAKAKK